VFPRPRGGRFDYASFYEQVWTPAKQKAQVAWLTDRGHADAAGLEKRRRAISKQLRQAADRALQAELDAMPATPSERVTLHTLRRTAVSWLRASRLPVEIIAQRLGHSDGGATLLAHYTAEARSGQMRAALDALGPGVRSRLRELEAPIATESDADSDQREPASTRLDHRPSGSGVPRMFHVTGDPRATSRLRARKTRAPRVGLEPTTLRLTAECSAN